MNKFFKYTFIALLGVLTLGLSSCTDEYEYTPTSKTELEYILIFLYFIGILLPFRVLYNLLVAVIEMGRMQKREKLL